MLEDVLASIGVRDRGPEFLGQRQHLVSGIAGALATVDHDLLGLRDELDGALQGVLGRSRHRPVGEDRMPQHLVVDLLGRHVAGEDHHADTALKNGRLQCELGDARHLRGRRDHRAVVRAAREDLLGVGLLEIAAPDLGTRDVGGYGKDRRGIALAVVQAVEQVHAARSGRTEYGGGTTGDLGIRPGCERSRLLVAHMHELDVALVPAQSIDDRIGRVADDAVNLPNADLDHLVDQDLRNGLRHVCAPVR